MFNLALPARRTNHAPSLMSICFLFRKHIPGACFFNIMEGVTHTEYLSRNIPEEYKFEVQARRLGITPDSHVIVYDACPGKAGFFIGGRAWWMFRVC